MDMEGALRARLLAAAPITALVAQRVYWVDRPQAASLPAITLQVITDDREQHMGGFQDLRQATVQVDCWATTYAQGKLLKEAVIAALTPAATSNGVQFRRSFVTSRDLSERTETAFIHRPSMDFNINYSAQ